MVVRMSDFDFTDEPTAAPAPAPKKTPARRPATRRRPTKSIDSILEGIRLYRKYDALQDSELRALAGMLSCEATADTVAASVASGVKPDTTVIESVVALSQTSNPFETGIRAHQLTENRKVFARVWELVAEYASLPVEPPKASTDAAMALAAAVSELEPADIEAIRSPLELLQR